MITATGFDTDLYPVIQKVLLTSGGSVVYIDGEYYYVTEFYPATQDKEYATLRGFPITTNLRNHNNSQIDGDSSTPVTFDFVDKAKPVSQQFHKDTPYRWFQNIYKNK